VKDVQIEVKLSDFINEFSDNLYCLELLIFFSRHPNARFNRSAILNAVKIEHFEASISLKHLVDRKVIATYAENGITLYGLTKEEPAHTLASQLISIDQHQWQIILEQLLNAQGIQ
jgi:hypothetical protein